MGHLHLGPTVSWYKSAPRTRDPKDSPDLARNTIHTLGRGSTGEILYAFCAGRRSTGEISLLCYSSRSKVDEKIIYVYL